MLFVYKCYPVSFIEKLDIEKTNKIILPPIVIEKISKTNVTWPLIFRVDNQESTHHTHCGVVEFTADEGCAYIPSWIMKNLKITEGDYVKFTCTDLHKGTYVKFKPQTLDFLNITNPKAVLELKLRNFTCLTKNDTIAIEYNKKIYWIGIVEVKPGNAISIIETDLDVEFVNKSKKYKKITIQDDETESSTI